MFPNMQDLMPIDDHLTLLVLLAGITFQIFKLLRLAKDH